MSKHAWTIIALRLQAMHLHETAGILIAHWPKEATELANQLTRRAGILETRAQRLILKDRGKTK